MSDALAISGEAMDDDIHWLKRLAIQQGWLKWAVCLSASFAAILEVIDVSIVNVALPYMQGNLGATLTEIGWVSTGYSIANVIVIPLSAWLGNYFGKRSYFLFSLVAFTFSSVLCGFAQDLPTLIIGRVLQGLGGGGLLAKAQALIFETFPKEEQPRANMVFTLGVISGPAIGPALGGFLTDQYGWRWIFFINVPLGILAVIFCQVFLPKDLPLSQRKVSGSVDWLGIFLLSIGLGSLQTVLEEGQQDDWFSSHFISEMSILSVISLALFVWHELTTKHPAVDLRVLRFRAVSAGSTISLAIGMGLYGTIFVVPVFAQNILQFTATKTGFMLIPGAFASAVGTLVLFPILKRVGPRLMIAIGCTMTMGVMAALSGINPSTGEGDLFWPLIFRGLSGVLMFIPLSMATLGSIPKTEVASASGLFSLTRQMGGSLGIAIITTLVEKMQLVHRSQLLEGITASNPAYMERLSAAQSAMQVFSGDPEKVRLQALTLVDRALDVQAALLSYRDVFYTVGGIFFLSLPLILLIGGAPPPAPAPVAPAAPVAPKVAEPEPVAEEMEDEEPEGLEPI